jgi:hypothetical protein
MAKILEVTDCGETYVIATRDVSQWVLNRGEWEDSDPVQKRLMVDGLEGCEELWPDWFRKEVEEFKAGWNEEVMS